MASPKNISPTKRRAEVRRLHSLGMRQVEIARAVGISRQRVHQIVGHRLVLRGARHKAFLAATPNKASELTKRLQEFQNACVDYLKTEMFLQSLTYKELATRIGLKNPSNVHSILNGKFDGITLSTILRISWALGLKPKIDFSRITE